TEAELHERLGALTRGSPPTGGGGGMMGGGVTEDYGGPPSRGGMAGITEIRVVDCTEGEMGGGGGASAAAAANENNWMAAEDSLSEQRSMDSWNSVDERTISPADIRRRLKEWVKKPRRQMRHTPDDPSAHAMSEPWEDKRERLRLASPYGRLPGWQLLPTIVKTGDDLRQELLAYQLLRALDSVWQEEGIPLVLRPYKILVLSHDSGMIEPIVNACSLHQIKRNLSAVYAEEGRTDAPSLLGHFIDCFGPAHSDAFMTAQTNLVRSTAAYSLACYFLQVKDRHNGNILIDSDGRLIHIDFGFILSASPRNLGFETSPFKLTTEIIEVMGGLDSDMFRYYKLFMIQGLVAARKHIDRIMNIVEIMIHGSPLACFRAGEACITAMRARFHLTATDKQLEALVDRMVEESRDSLRTRLYDNYQYYSNGIL
ncbi:pifk-1, partial [Pristionchus pacificus]